jgi:hypothetical protein
MITYGKVLRFAWAIFGIVLILGLITIAMLTLGAADPPKAGALQWHIGNLLHTVPPHEFFVFPQQIQLPAPPYTLEVAGTFDVESDPMAVWGISLLDSSTELLGVYLNGFQFYSVPPTQPDFTPFIHIRKNGAVNKLTLNIDINHHATLRINDEIAWQGMLLEASTARISFNGGINQPGTLTINSVSLYYPTN